jgi:hypothetical protein
LGFDGANRRIDAVRMTQFDGAAALDFRRRLGADWVDLVTLFNIEPDKVAAFPRGGEANAIWDWLHHRGRLSELPSALEAIDRPDLAAALRSRGHPAEPSAQPPAQPGPNDVPAKGPRAGRKELAVVTAITATAAIAASLLFGLTTTSCQPGLVTANASSASPTPTPTPATPSLSHPPPTSSKPAPPVKRPSASVTTTPGNPSTLTFLAGQFVDFDPPEPTIVSDRTNDTDLRWGPDNVYPEEGRIWVTTDPATCVAQAATNGATGRQQEIPLKTLLQSQPESVVHACAETSGKRIGTLTVSSSDSSKGAPYNVSYSFV